MAKKKRQAEKEPAIDSLQIRFDENTLLKGQFYKSGTVIAISREIYNIINNTGVKFTLI